jgi:DNA-binding PadR family transcriptional regulator
METMLQSMNYDELWTVIWEELDRVKKMTTDEYLAWQRKGNHPGSIPAEKGSYRTTEKGREALAEYARKWRRQHGEMRALVDEKDIDEIMLKLFGEILDKKHADRFRTSESDQVVIRRLLGERVTELSKDLVHYFPCHVFQTSAFGAFNIGPVEFIPSRDWPTYVEQVAQHPLGWADTFRSVLRGDMERPQRLLKATAEQRRERVGLDRAINMLEDVGSCAYMAKIRVPQKLGLRSRFTGEVAVRVAIDSLAALLPLKQARQLRGPQDDLAPRMKRPLTQSDGRDIRLSLAMDLPGWDIAKEDIGRFLDGYADYRVQVGNALTDFIGGDSKSGHPMLHRRWVEAMYWYGQAKRNTTDFMSLVECGVALDVLTQGGTDYGIKELCVNLLGVPGTYVIGNGLTLNKWVEKIYNDGRSQLSHGSKLGLLSDLPLPSGDAIDLLVVVIENFIRRLASYTGDDDAKAYRTWLATNSSTSPASS